MRINVRITNKCKSIGLCEFSLPKFCVLTGKNGSGKTHILEAMASTNHSSVGNKTACSQIKYISFGKLYPMITETYNPNDFNRFIDTTYEYIVYPENYGNSPPNLDFLTYVQKKMGLQDFSSITVSDLRKNFDIRFMSDADMLSGNFAMIFKNYTRLKEINIYNHFKKAKGHASMICGDLLTDVEFIEKHGIPPWELVNKVFERINIPYSVNHPEEDDIDSVFSLKLHDKENPDTRIGFSDLSTGEKVLMSLAMAVYNSDTDCKKPDLLLIDEPDAGLHPSMSKDMVNILREFIVEKMGIPVVITTHSPTTIAAMEDTEIYEKERGVDIPKKITKEEALTLLTSDIPFLTVSVENRRAVFVESQIDADIFSVLYEVYKHIIAPEPHFFPFYKDKSDGSNCENVINSAKNFKDCGDIHVYGIVDWDGIESRKTHDNLLVLGNCERYAIENYILDPFLVGLFLISERHATFSDFGVSGSKTHFDIPKINIKEAQQIIYGILYILGFASEKKRNYILHKGWELQTSASIFSMKGHMLEELNKTKFPCLNRYTTDAQVGKNLKIQIIKAVIEPCPEFLSKSVLETLLCIK